MGQVFEFISNHPLLVVAFVATVGMLGFSEYTRFFSGVKSLAPFVATQMLNSGQAIFVDVRSDSEYKNGHIINSKNMPVNQFAKHIHELEKFRPQKLQACSRKTVLRT